MLFWYPPNVLMLLQSYVREIFKKLLIWNIKLEKKSLCFQMSRNIYWWRLNFINIIAFHGLHCNLIKVWPMPDKYNKNLETSANCKNYAYKNWRGQSIEVCFLQLFYRPMYSEAQKSILVLYLSLWRYTTEIP